MLSTIKDPIAVAVARVKHYSAEHQKLFDLVRGLERSIETSEDDDETIILFDRQKLAREQLAAAQEKVEFEKAKLEKLKEAKYRRESRKIEKSHDDSARYMPQVDTRLDSLRTITIGDPRYGPMNMRADLMPNDEESRIRIRQNNSSETSAVLLPGVNGVQTACTCQDCHETRMRYFAENYRNGRPIRRGVNYADMMFARSALSVDDIRGFWPTSPQPEVTRVVQADWSDDDDDVP